MYLDILEGSSRCLELKEEDLILLQGEIQGTNDALTFTEAAEVANDEPKRTRQPSRSSRRRKRPRSICTMTNEVKAIKITNHEKVKYGRNCGEW